MDRNPSVSMLALNILMMAGGTDISCLAGSASVEAVSLDEVSSGLIGVSSDSMLASASAFVRVLFVETAFLPGDRFSVSLDAAAVQYPFRRLVRASRVWKHGRNGMFVFLPVKYRAGPGFGRRWCRFGPHFSDRDAPKAEYCPSRLACHRRVKRLIRNPVSGSMLPIRWQTNSRRDRPNLSGCMHSLSDRVLRSL